MDFKKLPSASKVVLDEILQSDKYDALEKHWMISPGLVCSGVVDYVEML